MKKTLSVLLVAMLFAAQLQVSAADLAVDQTTGNASESISVQSETGDVTTQADTIDADTSEQEQGAAQNQGTAANQSIEQDQAAANDQGNTQDQNTTPNKNATTTDAATNADGSITNPDGTITNADGSITNLDGTITNPDGSITNLDGTIMHPDGSITNLDGTITHPDGTITNPDGTLATLSDQQTTIGIQYKSHVQSHGWQDFVSNGQMSGTSGEAKRIEAFIIELTNTNADGTPAALDALGGTVQYKSLVQDSGWQDWVNAGATSGTTGESKRIEAIQIQLTDKMAEQYDIYYHVHVQSYGWLGWAKNGESAGTSGLSKRIEAMEIQLVAKDGEAPGSTDTPYRDSKIKYMTHVQTYGWQDWVEEGKASGTTGEAKRLESISIQLENQEYEGSIEYRTHVQTFGWQDWTSNGGYSGTVGQGKRLEAIEIRLTGEMAEHYDIYYRVHAQTYGWMGWAVNGGDAGSSGKAKRLEAIEIRLVAKGGSAPGSTEHAYRHNLVQYQTQVQTYGWGDWVDEPRTSGTMGEAKRMESINIQLVDPDFSGDIRYKTHVQSYGWQDWVSNGQTSGTVGESKRLEAIRIELTGEMAEQYDVYYRVHSQTYGWMNWVKNGEQAGSVGRAKRLEAIEIQIVGKNETVANPEAPLIARTSLAEKTNQILVVNANGGTMATLQLWDKNGNDWYKSFETPGFVGKLGIGQAKDYVPRTPEGAWKFGIAFGIDGNPGTKLEYRQITENSYWMGDTSEPNTYNTWQERPQGASSSEHLADYPMSYEFAIDIGYDGGVGGGAAFFLHVTNGKPTEGCIAVGRAQMLYFMRNIEPNAYILNVNSEAEILNY